MFCSQEKTKQLGWFALKIVVLAAALMVITRTLSTLRSSDWLLLRYKLLNAPLTFMALLFLMSLANWGVEMLKWQSAVKPFALINFSRAARETILAFGAGFITPFKLGEYALKAQFYHRHLKHNVVLSHFFCQLPQILCTLIFGLFGLLKWASVQPLMKPNLTRFLLILVFLLILTPIVIQTKKQLKLGLNISLKTLFVLFNYSVLRFVIFSSMFVVGLKIMGNPLNALETLFGVWTMYFIQVAAPTFSGLDVAVKGGSALLVFQGIIPAQIILGAVILQYCLSQLAPLAISLIISPKTRIE